MSNKSMKMLVCSASAALGLVFAAGPASGGIIFRGGFDPVPVYGGTVEIDVPSACILTTGWIMAGSGGGDCGVVDILSAFVQNPSPPAAATDTLTFAPPTVTNAISGLLWSSNTLIGIDSSTPLFAGPSGSFFNNSDGYELVFHSGHFTDATGGPEADLRCKTDDDDDDICSGLVGGTAAVFRDGFVVVPEPGSLLLVFGALAAVLGTRRRIRAA